MRIHQAVDDDVFPATSGGRQRTFGLARGLARQHEVRMLCVVPNRSPGGAHERVHGVEILRRRAWHTSLAWRLERLGLAPMFVTAWGHAAQVGRYRAALGEGADVLACDLHMAALLSRRGRALGVYASQNVEADRFAAERSPLLARSAWQGRIAALERRAVRSADLTVACSEADAERLSALHGLPPGRVVVIPNGFDELEIHAPVAGERAAARRQLRIGDGSCVLLFVGADWEPNRAALVAIERHVMPALAGEDVVLVVVGGVCRALRTRSAPWLRALGPVASLSAALHASDVGLNPVLEGGGSNVKLPMYLAAGLAVLTTPFGLRGYASLAPLVVAREPEGFADAIRGRPAGWAARGEPRPAAIERYAWGALGERLGEALAARLAGAAARGAA